jgi:hypothetical protein
MVAGGGIHDEHEIERRIEDRISICRNSLTAELRQINATLSGVLKAFPNDEEGAPDISGHRRYHDDLLRAARAQEQFWNEMRRDLARKGLWSLFIILIGLLVTGIQVKLGLIKFP